MRIKMIISFFVASFFLSIPARAQEKSEHLIQFSGVIVSSDSLNPVSFANIYARNSRAAATANYSGFFSMVVKPGEVLIFSAVGYKRASYRVPDTLTANRYSIVQVMTSDTIHLAGTTVYPWPSKENFRQEFIKLQVPDDEIRTIEKNVALITKRSTKAKEYNPDLEGMDGAMNFRTAISEYSAKQYYAGQGQNIQSALINPFAWAEFIKAWKRGDFKKQKD